jgi:hypothetical protein
MISRRIHIGAPVRGIIRIGARIAHPQVAHLCVNGAEKHCRGGNAAEYEVFSKFHEFTWVLFFGFSISYLMLTGEIWLRKIFSST